MIKPTVGRIVWYHPKTGEGPNPNGQPLAAIVAHVWSDTCVNLAIVDPNGRMYQKTSVLLVQDDAPRPDGCFAEWMPFQKGQAVKYEAAEGKATPA